MDVRGGAWRTPHILASLRGMDVRGGAWRTGEAQDQLFASSFIEVCFRLSPILGHFGGEQGETAARH